ncbi:MAG: hypothetical protein NTY38_23280, partial [Acidobacteria bacterium]|nr:hypothetical protein [Acidobacteriota bacterium]
MAGTRHIRNINHHGPHRREFLAASAAAAATSGGDPPADWGALVDPFDPGAIARAARCFEPVLRIP